MAEWITRDQKDVSLNPLPPGSNETALGSVSHNVAYVEEINTHRVSRHYKLTLGDYIAPKKPINSRNIIGMNQMGRLKH